MTGFDEDIAAAEQAMAARDHALAIARWEALIARDPEHPPEVLCRLAEAQLALRHYAAALKTVLGCLARTPGHRPASFLRDRILGARSRRIELRFRSLGSGHMGYIDCPTGAATAEALTQAVFRGWFAVPAGREGQVVLEHEDGSVSLHPMTVTRREAHAFLKMRSPLRSFNDVCGFDLTLDLLSVTRIGVMVEGAPVWCFAVEQNVIAQYCEGDDGWLFLAKDGNRSDKLFTGKLQPNPWQLYGWRSYAARLAGLQKGVKMAFVVAPSKETVMPERHPLPRGRRIASDRVTAILRDAGVNLVFPVARLAATEGSYYRTDTHWSHLGAFQALDECMTLFGLPDDWRALYTFRPLEVMGDLGAKKDPPATDMQMVSRWQGKPGSKKIFENGMLSTGEVHIFENPNAMVQEVLVIFGGSSAGALGFLASRIFRRVVRLNCPSTQPVLSVIEAEQARYVICQTNERYLLKAPAVTETLEKSSFPAALRALDPALRAKVLSMNAAAAEQGNLYARFVMEELERR